jgi:hypothetical protein
LRPLPCIMDVMMHSTSCGFRRYCCSNASICRGAGRWSRAPPSCLQNFGNPLFPCRFCWRKHRKTMGKITGRIKS